MYKVIMDFEVKKQAEAIKKAVLEMLCLNDVFVIAGVEKKRKECNNKCNECMSKLNLRIEE